MSSRPTIIRSSVDFPQPDGPTRIMNSPSWTSMLTSFTARKPSPYSLTMFFMSMAAMSHPFTAPDVSPATIFRWNSRTMMMIGTVTTTEAVASCPYGGLNGAGPTEEGSCAGTVREAVVDVSESASTNSFHAKKKVRIAAVKTPGDASGTITLRNACHVVAPSTWAACSISQGISRKNADSVQIASGNVNDMYGMIRPGHVLNRPSARHRSNSGPTSATTGNIAIASAIDSTNRLPLNSRRAIAYAASVARITERVVEIAAMPNELIKESRKSVLLKMSV